jgi:hypothetical protein
MGFLTGEFISFMVFGCSLLSEYFPHSISLVCAQGSGPFLFSRELLTVEQLCDLRTAIYKGQVSLVQDTVGRRSVLLACCSDHLIPPTTAFYGASEQYGRYGDRTSFAD